MSINRLGMICLRGVNLDAVGGRATAGGTSWADVAGALSGVDRRSLDLAYYLFQDDKMAGRRLKAAVVDVMVHASGYELSLYLTEFNGLAEAVMQELLRPEPCRVCGGGEPNASQSPPRGEPPEARPQGGSKRCSLCNGAGVTQWSIRRVARTASLDDRTFQRRWSHIHGAGYRAMCSWLAGLSNHLQEQFST
ncbi:MAG TPA: hypothetical protein VNR18_13375 [Hyphomicrobiales bacterium]|nr:hypothetical protein [Hyphomicrobiales bacterium]